MKRMGFGGVELLRKQESIIMEGALRNSDGSKLGCEESREGLLLLKRES